MNTEAILILAGLKLRAKTMVYTKIFNELNDLETELFIFKLNKDLENINLLIELKRPKNILENKIEYLIAEIEVYLRLKKMNKDQAKKLIQLQDDLRDLYNEI